MWRKKIRQKRLERKLVPNVSSKWIAGLKDKISGTKVFTSPSSGGQIADMTTKNLRVQK